MSSPPPPALIEPSTTEDPLVSVLMPVFNGGEFLRPAVESVLAQTYRNFELLVLDDGSTDGCMATIAGIPDSRLRRFQHPNRGKPATLNRALDEMHGEFFALQDADDLSHSTRLARQVSVFLQNPDVAGVFCGHELLIEGKHVAPLARGKDRAACATDIWELRMPAHDPTVMFRTSLVRQLRFVPELTLCEGLDHILQVGELHPLLVMDECLYSYRIYPDSLTRRHADRVFEMSRFVRSRADTRRGVDNCILPMEAEAPHGERFMEHGIVTHFVESVVDQKRRGRPMRALRTAWQCAAMKPGDIMYLKPLAFAAAPYAAISTYRRLRHRPHA